MLSAMAQIELSTIIFPGCEEFLKRPMQTARLGSMTIPSTSKSTRVVTHSQPCNDPHMYWDLYPEVQRNGYRQPTSCSIPKNNSNSSSCHSPNNSTLSNCDTLTRVSEIQDSRYSRTRSISQPSRTSDEPGNTLLNENIKQREYNETFVDRSPGIEDRSRPRSRNNNIPKLGATNAHKSGTNRASMYSEFPCSFENSGKYGTYIKGQGALKEQKKVSQSWLFPAY